MSTPQSSTPIQALNNARLYLNTSNFPTAKMKLVATLLLSIVRRALLDSEGEE